MKQLRSAALLSGALFLLVGSSSLRAGVIFTNIFSFSGTNGDIPTVLVQAGNNKFYGIIQNGGPNFTGPGNTDVGGVFSITSDGVFSNLFFFEVTNGIQGTFLTSGRDGNFYGTTSDTVFKLNPDGTMANPQLAAFAGPSDFFGLVQDHDGTLYGTTRFGGPSGYGTIYKIDTNGVFSTLSTFNGTNGTRAESLLLGLDDSFYGLSYQSVSDPSNGYAVGSIFRMDRNGNLTNIFFLDSTPSRLVQGSDGDLYGLTDSGGTNSAGSIFKVTTNGVLVWSFSFNGTNGYIPIWLTAANDGNFYGVTDHGGSSYNPGVTSGFGTIFRITPNGSFTSLVQFDGTDDLSGGTIIQGTDGALYGTSMNGGAFGNGAIFKLTLPTCPTNRFMLTDVANFNDTSGIGGGLLALMQGRDGMLYGVAESGGAFSLGTLFRCTLSGSLTTLVSFNGTNGARPTAPPLQAPDGYFYGTAGGGPDWNPTNSNATGIIYRMDTNGVLTTIFSFHQTNGAGPGGASGLIAGNDGALYGVAPYGGPDFTNSNGGDGTIFKITTNGDFTLLASFNGANGVGPACIIQASDGNFYGTTVLGGVNDTNGLGTVFQMTPDRQINTLVRFNGTNGLRPVSIMQASDGCLYGTTRQGGASYTGAFPDGYGTVFKVTTNGDFTVLASFDTTNGALPFAGLIEVCNGLFYGTANAGGLYPNGPGFEFNEGTFFQITTNGELTALLSFDANTLLPEEPYISLIKASDGNYYGTAQGPDQGSIFCVRPVQAPLLQPLAQPGQFNLNWNAWAGYSYAVMYETNLTGSNWNLLSTVSPQTNGMTSCSDSIGPDTQRFYRVVLQLP